MDARTLRRTLLQIVGLLAPASLGTGCLQTCRDAYDNSSEVELSRIRWGFKDAGSEVSDPSSGFGGAAETGDAGAEAGPTRPCVDYCRAWVSGGEGASPQVKSCNFTTKNGEPAVHCEYHYAESCLTPGTSEGRRPQGLLPARGLEARDALGALFAHMAWLEAASVPAFVRLRNELRMHGAPRRLVAAAERAIRDEVRHRRTMTALARARGARPPRVRLAVQPVRSLPEIAAENAIEGCVRETFGAITALHQARHASDPQLRRIMAEIAEDELRHAALAFQVASWIETRLDVRDRRRVQRARAGAVRALRREIARTVSTTLVREAGLPDARSAEILLSRAAETLWT